jgi:hypothetical protein
MLLGLHWCATVVLGAPSKDGAELLNFTAFYETLLDAKGVSLETDTAARGKGAGNLLVG